MMTSAAPTSAASHLRQVVEVMRVATEALGLRPQLDDEVREFCRRHQGLHLVPAFPTVLRGEAEDLPAPPGQQPLRGGR